MIGRYTKQKNHLLVINCFKKLIEKKMDINLIIIGNGELKNKYFTEISRLNLESRVQLLNYQKNISIYLNKSLALISSSLWEFL